jgi:hypothetical protein
MKDLHPGVTYFEDDRNSGPFSIRIGGTSEFVSEIDPDWKRSWPPGKVVTVEDPDNWPPAKALKYDTMDEALVAADQVWEIEGYHTSIEIGAHT